ncbi:LOW QUALITY PROTEIN: CD40 ligand-like [Heterodontus francisci]|uniref:LOW QUALITY PROTEIN: CD40 ligand-like n=1 Tax=Heterodontus francisci TaxID=7792 RepID=UPI00355AD072
MLSAGSSSVKEVLIVSALVHNMNETSNKSTQQQKGCEQQPSVSIRVLIYLIVLLLLGHMITSALLYVYFSIKLDKAQQIESTDREYTFLQIIKKCENKNQAEKDKDFCDEKRSEIQRLLQKYLSNNTEEKPRGTGEPKQERQIGNHPGTTSDSIHSNRRTAAHLIAPNKANDRAETTFPPGKGSPIKQWMAKGFPAFTHNINYTSGKLVITDPGFYYIYCQISFRLSSNKTGSTSIAPFLQYIYLQRTQEQATLLMKASKTPVNKNQASSFNSINEGGVFELKTGDQLFVSVTDPNLLSYGQATYFGIFKL